MLLFLSGVFVGAAVLPFVELGLYAASYYYRTFKACRQGPANAHKRHQGVG